PPRRSSDLCPDFSWIGRNCAPRNASSVSSRTGSVIGAQFVSQAGLGQQLAGGAIVVLVNQNTARQDTERSLDDTHVLVQHQMMDIGAVEQRADCRNQHDIVGPDQFPQVMLS